MSIVTMILGDSGSGKTSSIRNLDPKDVLLIQAVDRPLPFKPKGWSVISKENPDGSIYVTDVSAKICQAIIRTTKKIIVIDDFQYTMCNEFMRRVLDNESANGVFQKYNEIAKNAWDILTVASSQANDKRIYVLSHLQHDDFGRSKIKTIGKLLDDKVTLEGLVSIVFKAQVINERNVFCTKNSGNDTVKTPIGMFYDAYIDNDLKVIDDVIYNYYFGE